MYDGHIDENGIWRIWNSGEDYTDFGFTPEMIITLKKTFKDKMKGGFHIWPKRKDKKSKEFTEEDELIKSSKLKEIYIEHLG